MHIIKLHEVRKKQKNCESFILYVTFMLYLNLDKEANMKNKNYFILMKYRFNNLYFILPTCKYQKGEGYEYEENLINCLITCYDNGTIHRLRKQQKRKDKR